MPVHLFLDWSGTLCDDFAHNRNLINTVIRSFGGVETTPEEFRRESGRLPLPFFINRVPPQSCPTPERIHELFNEAAALLPVPQLFPGVRELVECARQHGGSARVFATVPQIELDRIIDQHGLRPLLSGVFGGILDKTRTVPEIIENTGLSPDDCLLLGDMPHDLKAARAARVRACAVLHGYSSEKELRAEHPDEIWHDLFEARAWLERHLMLETRSWPIATVGGLVFRDDGKAFFVRTAKWSERWGTPGGKIDYGEGHLDAFVREVREETGIETLDPELVLVQDAIEEPEFVRPRHFLLLNLVGRAAAKEHAIGDGGIRLNHESIDGGWFTLEESLELELNRPTRVLVEFLLARRSDGGCLSSRSS